MRGVVAALQGRALPCAVVDLDALDANIARVRQVCGGVPLRVASKSVRHLGLLRRILEGGPFQGVMCFTVPEAVFLADQGVDDLFVAYPTLQHAPLVALARSGRTTAVVADCRAHLTALGRAGVEAGRTLDAVLEIDVSLRGPGVHLGARRSPLRSADQVVALARAAADIPGVQVVGLMGYEGHVAGVPDALPGGGVSNLAKRALKRVAQPRVAQLRADAVAGLQGLGLDLRIVNGGGTGSLHLTRNEPAVTELTAGSAFLCPHLFSAFADLDYQPAAWFACEAVRSSDADMVTVLGGGYVASGSPGWDKVPQPVWPAGAALVDLEGAGEVQTPVRGVSVELGSPVLFRHAKAGELAERFNEYVLVRDGRVVAVEPTYRGMGQAFL
jgi:D-serine deaminase-like pyridoxal phosphate-dependent protein